MVSTTASADLRAEARIRNAALKGFALQGITATSVREIARSAGVSPGLVQHHFPSKAALRTAVNEHVGDVARRAFADVPEPDSLTESLKELGLRVARFVREQPDALLYVARAAADGQEAALRSFDVFVEIAERQWRALADRGLLNDGIDLPWAALQVTLINLGAVLFADAVSRHLPASFHDPDQLDRWQHATTALFEHGLALPALAAREEG